MNEWQPPMTEWQPARVRSVHGPGDLSPEQNALLERLVLRVRPFGRSWKEEYGCPIGSLLYEVHPEDCEKIWGLKALAHVCEHELLTD